MAFRDWCNEHRGIVTGVVIVCILVAIGSIVWQIIGNRRRIITKLPDAFFSVDDGKTFFVAGGNNVPPFDYQGKVALHAYVFECGGKRFVGYLERYTPEAHKAMVENKATPGTMIYGRELKKPGSNSWVSSGNFKAAAMVADVRCPDGNGDPVEVEP